MRAAILAGGAGTRIGSLYPDLPKPMIPVLGKPLIQYQVESLTTQGIYDITLILGYKTDVIRTHFKNGKTYGARINYIVEDEPLGTGGALSMLPRENTLILFGDIYCEVDFKRFIDFHKQKHADITLFVHPNSHPHDSDLVVVDADGRVTAWKSKNDSYRGDLRNLANAGLYVFSGNALPTDEIKKQDLDYDLVMRAIPGGKVYAYRSTEYVKDMGTPERLQVVEDDVKSGMTSKRNLGARQKAVFLDRDGTINELRGLINLPEQMELIRGVAVAIRMLNKSPYLTLCITNQPVIARGTTTLDQLEAIHSRLDSLLGDEGAYLDDLLFCPHHPDKGYPEEVPEYKMDCECRKPKPGMLLTAAERYNIDLSRSYMIGDSTADIASGNTAGCMTIGIKTGKGLSDGKYNVSPTMMCECVYDAIRYILREKS